MSEYLAYHGTNSKNVESIKKDGFTPSSTYNDWLGYGVYFFIDGSFCPVTNARDWGINNAWDNKLHEHKYTTYSILLTVVSGERILDLREEDDLGIFETLRAHILKKYEKEKSSMQKKLHPDTFLCNSVSKSMRLDILIQNLYIKTKYQRVNRIHSRIPNSTVLCAKNTAKIEVDLLDEIEKRGVTDE